VAVSIDLLPKVLVTDSHLSPPCPSAEVQVASRFANKSVSKPRQWRARLIA